MKIRADRDLCIGAGSCVLAAPGLFDQDSNDDDRVLVLRQPESTSDAEAAREAVENCPSGALSLDEES